MWLLHEFSTFEGDTRHQITVNFRVISSKWTLEGIEMMCGKCHVFVNLCTIVLLSALLLCRLEYSFTIIKLDHN